jgi:uncharacterized membrane protein YvlD (DUF360 family)
MLQENNEVLFRHGGAVRVESIQ